MHTDYEEQESIEYEQEAGERLLTNRRRERLGLVGKIVGRFALAILTTMSILVITAIGWNLILVALGVSTEEWTIRNWAYLALGTQVIVVAAAQMYNRSNT